MQGQRGVSVTVRRGRLNTVAHCVTVKRVVV